MATEATLGDETKIARNGQPDPALLGAAVSKLLSASVGDICLVLSPSSQHKYFSLADIEWKVLPAVLAGQFYVSEAKAQEGGFRAPVAFITWARVSGEVDQRLTETAGQPAQLQPEEWTSGDIGWLVDAVGDSRGLNTTLRWLKGGPFKEHSLKVAVRDQSGAAAIQTLDALIAAATAASSVA